MSVKGRELLQEGWCVLDASNDDMLEAWMLFCIAVAGKTAKTTTKAINRFLEPRGKLSPFEYVTKLHKSNRLEAALRAANVGMYGKLTHAFHIVSALNQTELRTWSPREFEYIRGIGPKTSRFFIQSTREDTRYAVLDTHVLAWMRENGFPDAPRTTPNKKAYGFWEMIFLRMADDRGISPRDLDTEIWLSRARV